MSNRYPTWWNTTLTLYNKYEDPQTQIITWHRHVLENCFWQYVGSSIRINNIVIGSGSVICRIPESSSFIDKHSWILLPNDQMSRYFTLAQGDIVIKGNVSDTIDEYSDGHRSTDILSKYSKFQECLEIGSISINVGGGRNNPHYLVSDSSSRTWDY